MRPGKDFVGKPIYSITDGQHLGNVKDLLLDVELNSVKAIFVGQEGLFKRKALLIPIDRVAVLGVDAILTYSSDAVTDSNELLDAQKWLRREELQGRDVDTPGGTKVGVIGDVMVDRAAQITAFTLSRTYVTGPVAENRLVPKAAVVDSGSADGAMTVDLTKAEQADEALVDETEAPYVVVPPEDELTNGEPDATDEGPETSGDHMTL
jgi:uncharacterized protein YrrD